MMAQLFLETKGVVARQLVAAPFHLPWFECFGAFKFAFVVCRILRLSIFCFANETAVHAVFEDVDLVGFSGHRKMEDRRWEFALL